MLFRSPDGFPRPAASESVARHLAAAAMDGAVPCSRRRSSQPPANSQPLPLPGSNIVLPAPAKALRPQRNGLRETTLHRDSPRAGAESRGCSWPAQPRQCSADCGWIPARHTGGRNRKALARRTHFNWIGSPSLHTSLANPPLYGVTLSHDQMTVISSKKYWLWHLTITANVLACASALAHQ